MVQATISGLESQGYIIRKTYPSGVASGETIIVASPPGTHIGQEKVFTVKGERIIRTQGYISPAEAREASFKLYELEAKRQQEIQKGIIKPAPAVPMTAKQVIEKARALPGGATPENIRAVALTDPSTLAQERIMLKEETDLARLRMLQARRERAIEKGIITPAPMTAKQVIERARKLPTGATPEHIFREATRDYYARKQQLQIEKEEIDLMKYKEFLYKRYQEVQKGIIKPGKLPERAMQIYSRLEKRFAPLSKKYIPLRPKYSRPSPEVWDLRYSRLKEGYYKDITGVKAFLAKGYVKSMYASEKVGLYYYDIETGFRRGLREKPVKTVSIASLMFVSPLIFGKVGALGRFASAKVTGLFPSTAKLLAGASAPLSAVGTGIKYAIPAYYAKTSIDVIAREPTPVKKREKLGEILSTEITPMIVGGVAGVKFWPKISGYVSTIGRKELDVKKLIPPEVLTGQSRFPVSKADPYFQLKLAKAHKFTVPGLKGFFPHATPQKFRVLVAGAGRSEFKGLSVSLKGISPYFFRLDKAKYALYGGRLFEQIGGVPRAYFIKPVKLKVAKFKKIPGVPDKPFGYKFVSPVKKGDLYITGLKTEPEGIFIEGTKFAKVSKEYFIRLKGLRIPIDKLMALPDDVKAVMPKLSKMPKSVPDYAISSKDLYSYLSYKPKLTTPESLSSLVLLKELAYSSIKPVSSPRIPKSSMSNILEGARYQPFADSSRIMSELSRPSSLKPSKIYLTPPSRTRAYTVPPSKPYSVPSVTPPSKPYSVPVPSIKKFISRIIKTPPPSRPTYFPPIVPIFPRAKRRITRIKPKRKRRYDLFYVPDFTSKALGITSEVKDLDKLIRSLKTGFELRPLMK